MLHGRFIVGHRHEEEKFIRAITTSACYFRETGGIIESLLARRKYADHESVIEDERTCPSSPSTPDRIGAIDVRVLLA